MELTSRTATALWPPNDLYFLWLGLDPKKPNVLRKELLVHFRSDVDNGWRDVRCRYLDCFVQVPIRFCQGINALQRSAGNGLTLIVVKVDLVLLRLILRPSCIVVPCLRCTDQTVGVGDDKVAFPTDWGWGMHRVSIEHCEGVLVAEDAFGGIRFDSCGGSFVPNRRQPR